MPLGTLDHSKLDEAAKLWESYGKHRANHKEHIALSVEQIATERDKINREIEKVSVERRRAVVHRDADAKIVVDYPKQCDEANLAIETATSALKKEKSSLEELKKQQEEGRKRRDHAIEVAKQQEKELSQLMGRGDMETPWPDKPVPELSPDVRTWAEKFVSLKRQKTIAYFKSESEKFGALIDLKTIADEIGACNVRIEAHEDTITRAGARLETLRQEKERAETAAAENQKAVLDAQSRIDGFKKKLENFDYSEHLHRVLGSELEAVKASVRVAQAEVQGNLTKILGEIRAVKHDKFTKRITGQFVTFEGEWEKASKELKQLKLGTDPGSNISTLSGKMDDVQRFAGRVDTFVKTELPKAADGVRFTELTGIKNDLCDKVASRRSSENGLGIRGNQLYIDPDLLRKISALCDPLLPVVQEEHLGPLEVAVERAYDFVQSEVIAKKLKESKNREEAEQETNRLLALDAVGEETEFSTLAANKRKSVIAPYKAMAKELATPEIVRGALRAALTQQRTPDRTRWGKILGLPGKSFFDARRFTDSSGSSYDCHVSFFPSSLGSATDGQIAVFKSEGVKHTPAEVMARIFATGEATGRAHATIEAFDNGGRKPHVYYGGLAIQFWSVFKDTIEVEEDHDEDWEANAEEHARQALADRMAVIQGKVKTWLDKDGDV